MKWRKERVWRKERKWIKERVRLSNFKTVSSRVKRGILVSPALQLPQPNHLTLKPYPCKSVAKISPLLLHSLLPINLPRKLREEIQQRSPSHLLQRSLSSFCKHAMRSRFPRRRQHPSAKRSPIQSPLRPQMLLAAIVSN